MHFYYLLVSFRSHTAAAPLGDRFINFRDERRQCAARTRGRSSECSGTLRVGLKRRPMKQESIEYARRFRSRCPVVSRLARVLVRGLVLATAAALLVLASPAPAFSESLPQTASVFCLFSRTNFKGQQPIWVNQAPLPTIQYGNTYSTGIGTLNLARVSAVVSVRQADTPADTAHVIELQIIDRNSLQVAGAEGTIDFKEHRSGFTGAASFTNVEKGERVDYRLSCRTERGDRFQ